MKKLTYLVTPLMCFSTLVSCGGGKPAPAPVTHNVTYNKEDIVLDNVIATEGVNYLTHVSIIDSKKEQYLLTDDVVKPIKIKINDKVLSNSEYLYQPANDMTSAKLEINVQFITGDIDIYIPVIENVDEYYIVDFDSNGGSYVSPRLVKSHNLVTEPQKPERTHFFFKYWYLEDQKGIPFEFNKISITKDIKLIAYWENDPAYYVRFSFTGFLCKINDKSSVYTEDIEIGDESKPNVKHYEVTSINDAKLPNDEDVYIENEYIKYHKVSNNLAYLNVTPKKNVTVPYKVEIVAQSANYATVIIQTENCLIGYSSYIAEALETNKPYEYLVTPQPGYTLPETVTVKSVSPTHDWFSYTQSTGKIVLNTLKASIFIKVEAYAPTKMIWNAYHSENVNTRYDDEVGFNDYFSKEYELGKKVDILLFPDANEMSEENVKFYINGINVPYGEKSSEGFEWKWIDRGNLRYNVEYIVPEKYNGANVSNIFVDIQNHEDFKISIDNQIGGNYFLKIDDTEKLKVGKTELTIPLEYRDVYLMFTCWQGEDTPCQNLTFEVIAQDTYKTMDFYYYESKDTTSAGEKSVLLVRPTESFIIRGHEKE